MKKIKIVLTAFVMLLSFSSFANDPEKITPAVKAAFESSFSNATMVEWEKEDDFYFASFLLNNVKIEVAYTESGELLGTSRRVSLDQMPLVISLALANKYAGYKVDNSVTEITYNGATNYHIIVANETQLVRLKCGGNGELEVESRTKR